MKVYILSVPSVWALKDLTCNFYICAFVSKKKIQSLWPSISM